MHQEHVGDQREVGEHAEQAVADDHEHGDQRRSPTIEAMMPARIESAPRLGPDRALLDDRQLCRQRAGAQQNREVVGRLRR